MQHDLEKMENEDDDALMDKTERFMMGKVAAVVNETKSAKEIVDELIHQAAAELQQVKGLVKSNL